MMLRNHMKLTSTNASLLRQVFAPLALIASTALSGCYVVPLESRNVQPAPQPTVASPAPLVFPARLYPANDLAGSYGVINATVTNDRHGRGVFNATINGEAFSGEATRSANSSRDGTANGAGNRGSYLSCTYTMNSSTQGTGLCRHSNGAQFNMHVGN